jgi:hypothetical protein
MIADILSMLIILEGIARHMVLSILSLRHGISRGNERITVFSGAADVFYHIPPMPGNN